ncbi:MAG: phosphate ABC transporter permease PstA [Dehalococcoidia bacterium]|nr:phosphate ABC transporter permease PstA [Dehalococcoidia bacterium]
MIKSYEFRRGQSSLFLVLCALCAALCIAVLLYMVGYVFVQGASYINFDFFVQTPRPLGESGGGAANSLVGTLVMVGIASLIGIPVGLGCGILVSEYAGPRLGGAVRFLADVLSGVPSIVVGIFVFELIVVRQGHFSALAGAVALAVIMLPIVARASEEMLKLVPVSQREAALALGIPRWRTVASVVLPAAMSGLVTGALLAIARASGETAPLLFTALGNRFMTTDINQPMDSLPLHIYRYAIGPYDQWHQEAWASAFFLIMIVLVVNVCARLLATRLRGGMG